MFDEKLMRIANDLVAGCRDGREYENLDKLYAKDAVSIEAADFGGGNVVTEGRDAIKGKHDWWNGAMEVHDQKTDGPFLHGDNQFGVIYEIDATEKNSGQRMQMREVGVYTVENGEIVREQFFAGMP